MSANQIQNQTISSARPLRTLYFTRVTFSVIWVILIALFAKSSPTLAGVLVVIYPAWDVIGTILDIRANRNNGNLIPQYINLNISIIATVAVAIALSKGIPAVLIVFGVWAGLTGAIQLILGLRRRRSLGGQWPMILSGGQSIIAGIAFIAQAKSPNMGIVNLAGYSAFGAFYYLLAAISLSKAIHKADAGNN
ncbi:DUF308 domain-containing protein [Mucilaginibacter sp.]|uniref:DUF308 domain-containing protein n=1 Tax=Mucilaginibacter sp. TaxID=1882438 RepID=UPI0035BC7982